MLCLAGVNGSEGKERQDMADMVASEDVGMRLNHRNWDLETTKVLWVEHVVAEQLHGLGV